MARTDYESSLSLGFRPGAFIYYNEHNITSLQLGEANLAGPVFNHRGDTPGNTIEIMMAALKMELQNAKYNKYR